MRTRLIQAASVLFALALVALAAIATTPFRIT